MGAFISGANNNGAHSANGIKASFIATGQDVAGVVLAGELSLGAAISSSDWVSHEQYGRNR